MVYSTYKHGDDWWMVYDGFNHMSEDLGQYLPESIVKSLSLYKITTGSCVYDHI